MNCAGPFAPTAPPRMCGGSFHRTRFVFSSTGKALHRPEFLFLDTPGDPNIMVSCSEIISDYEGTNTLPGNLENVVADPF